MPNYQHFESKSKKFMFLQILQLFECSKQRSLPAAKMTTDIVRVLQSSLKMHLMCFGIGILVLFSSPVNAQQNAPVKAPDDNLQIKTSTSSGYNPSVTRLSLQVGSGVLFGTAGGVSTGLAAIGLFVPDTDGPGAGFGAMGAGIIGFILGYPAGTSLGIYIVANSNTYNASFGNILFGSFLGAGAGLGTIALSNEALGNDTPLVIPTIAALSMPIIGGIVANKLSINRRNNTNSALLNFSNNQADFSFPAVQLTKIGNKNFTNRSLKNSYSPTMKLLNISL